MIDERTLIQKELTKLLIRYGTRNHISTSLPCRYCTTFLWYEKTYVSPAWALKLEAMTKGYVKRHLLCPSVFDPAEYKVLWPHIVKINGYDKVKKTKKQKNPSQAKKKTKDSPEKGIFKKSYCTKH